MVKTEHLAVVSERMEGVWLKLNIEQLSVRGWRVCV